MEETMIMVTINVTIPNAMKDFVDRQVLTRGLGGADEYIRALVQDAYNASLEAKLLQGIDALENGGASEMTSEEWQRLRRDYKEAQHEGSPK
jgi:antitoxin ParD1/3/4